MKILWFTWKDRIHPEAGGAETVNEELAKRLARDGHEVIFIVGGYPGCCAEEMREGFKVIRLGGQYSVYWLVYRYYKKHLRGWADLVIDEMNTIPFFARFYVKERSIMFVHQLCREIWFYQMRFPLNIIGYFLEPMYLWLLRKNGVITISESTKKDLMKYGFLSDRIRIISQGIDIGGIENPVKVDKYPQPTVLSFGSIREMKRTLHQVRSFEIAKQKIPNLQMKIAGDASSVYGKKVLGMIDRSPYKNDIEYFGRVGSNQKIDLMRKSHVIAVTSVKEGWGLIVTEANSQGTPAVVYDVDGLRDSVRNGETGVVVNKNTSQGLAEGIIHLLKDSEKYAKIKYNALQWSKEFDFEKSYREFIQVLNKI